MAQVFETLIAPFVEMCTNRWKCVIIKHINDESTKGSTMHRTLPLLTATALAVALPLFSPSTSEATTPTCFGRTVTIMGTDGPDNLAGQSGVRDVIYGGGGNDIISGGDFYQSDATPGAAPDFLCGGPGNDTVYDSPGSDYMNGGDGNDTVATSGQGNDHLNGNAGDDVVRDKSCEDCGSGDDTLHGNGGNDMLGSGWGQDRVYGDAGDDDLIDSECDGPTYLDGGTGNDYIESWSSSYEGWHGNVCNSTVDQIIGGPGTMDHAQVDRPDHVTTVEVTHRITQPTQ